ncbi:MAG: tRNA uridine-5-carboxymethylaminomethyl(34) synthesis GTPase MnmE [Bdellovibrionales bacterium]|nr:tRNA uridine-5-carboxymethylaminomethyl(34) synthesis GTPase MnmE [Bdellovibrionales bacterium]
MTSDTIAAPITAPGRAGVSVVRVSGAGVRGVIEALCPAPDSILEQPRRVHLVELRDLLSADSDVLDEALLCFFAAPNSFTGEDCAEFHLHGSPFLVRRLLENLRRLSVRMAEPGEFTRRAFENGRIDLPQAEAVADLIAAETESQARAAREQLAGRLSHALSDVGEPLRNLLAEIEAWIDFPDEDIEQPALAQWQRVVDSVRANVSRLIDSYTTGKLLRSGALVALVGLPNAGKSSLLNRLLDEERAIVTDIPGTTRDSIEELLDLRGLLVRLCDTAGIGAAHGAVRAIDPVEALGIERSWKKLESADLVLFLLDPTQELPPQQSLLSEARSRASRLLLLQTKSDLSPARADALAPDLQLSAKTGDGVPALLERLYRELLGEQSAGAQLITTQRHYEALIRARESLTESLAAMQSGQSPEFLALEIRSALGALDEIIGVTQTEDILGRIFSKFCIGK